MSVPTRPTVARSPRSIPPPGVRSRRSRTPVLRTSRLPSRPPAPRSRVPGLSCPPPGASVACSALAHAVEDHAEELAQIESLDNGKPVGLAQYVDVRGTVAHLRYFAGWPTKIEGAVLPVAAGAGMHCYTRREPVGVCAQIIPWNFPLLMAAWKLGPALAAGCTVVLKPAEQTPLSALRLGELALEVGFPPGVLNVLTGDGATGAALVEHPDVDKIAFTGSTAVGREIGAKAGRALKRVTLELGGKSPNIILPDADIDAAVEGRVPGDLLQLRPGLQRRLAPVRSRRALRRGDERAGAGAPPPRRSGPASIPARSSGRLSPPSSRSACSATSTPVAPQAPSCWPAATAALTDSGGYFVAPTLFSTTSDELPIAREEIFGPVLVASPYDTLEEVAARANASEYGLAAGVWTRDVSQRPPARRDAARRDGLHQHLGRRRPVGAVRGLQGLRHRPRARPRRPRRLSGDQDGLDGAVESWSGSPSVRSAGIHPS